MTTTLASPACGWDQADFRCGWCGAQHTATTENGYLTAVGAHHDAGPKPANRTVPEEVVVKQRQDMFDSCKQLKSEGFPEIVYSDSLHRLLPYLRQLSKARTADLGMDDGDGLGDLLLVSRTFGPEILPLWQWKDDSTAAGGDRVGEIRLGQQYLTLALRTNVDGEGDVGFDVAVPCPFDPECTGYAWGPAYSVTNLYKALNGVMDSDPDLVCTVHGGYDDVDQEDDDHADSAAYELEARATPGPRRPAAPGGRRRPVSRAAPGQHPHPLTPADLPAGDEWFHGCPDCHLPIQGGRAGLVAHRRTVHTRAGDPRTPITVRIDH